MKLTHFKRKKYFKKISRKNKRIARAKMKEGIEMVDNVTVVKEIDPEELKWLERDREAHEQWQAKLRITMYTASDTISKTIIDLIPEPTKPVPRLPFDLPYHNPFEPDFLDVVPREICHFYRRTGVCRFDNRCSRVHETPVVSDTIVFINMFNASSMEQVIAGGDPDQSLEFDENELLDEYQDFYVDVKKEFASFGKLITIRTCRNAIRHLRGNVYVQYKNINDSVYAFSQLNGRFYAGSRLWAKFVTIDNWRESICGLFFRGYCPKGKICNFLHVLLNPGENRRDLYRFLNRCVDGDHKMSSSSLRYRNRSRTCSSSDDVSTPERHQPIHENKKNTTDKKRNSHHVNRERSKSKSGREIRQNRYDQGTSSTHSSYRHSSRHHKRKKGFSDDYKVPVSESVRSRRRHRN